MIYPEAARSWLPEYRDGRGVIATFETDPTTWHVQIGEQGNWLVGPSSRCRYPRNLPLHTVESGMNVDRRALRSGVAVGGFGVLVQAVTQTALLVVAPPGLAEAEAVPYFGTWFSAIAWSGLVLGYGMVLVAPVVAFAVAFGEERDAGPVAAGLGVGALVFGLGVAGVAWTVSNPAPPVVEYLRMGLRLSLVFAATGTLGALGGDVVGPLFRSPEGEDGQHPRW